MKKSLKASLIAVAIASFPFGSQAAGLGQINVLSGLGQPLRAEIQINATPQELQTLTAKVASPEAFRQANIPYASAIAALRATVEHRGQRAVVKLSSDRPINDPFVDLLVELDWDAGRLAREYTFLLDPVDIAAPRPLAARVDTPAAAPARAVRPEAPAAQASQDGGASYRVQRGDTLRRIAESNRPADATLDQMLVALYRSNPAAFDGGNINRLKAGAILSIPSGAAVGGVDATEARREVVAQAADFDAYRRRLASAAVERPAEAPAAEQSGSGRIVPRVDAPAAAPAGDKVQISRTQESGQGPNAEVATRLQSLEEELVSREKALDEANARLAQLEQNIRELQKLLQLKSESMAQAQAGAAGVPAAPAPEAAPPAPVAAPAAPVAEAPAAPKPEETPPPAPAPAPVPAPAVEDEGFVQSLLKDPALLAAGGGVAALLLVFAGLRLRKRRQEADTPQTSALMSEFPPDSSAVFGATGGQSVDTSNSSVIQTDFSQSGLSSIDADEGVDPVAEADVYMAYGRDAQAEEILLDALKADPERVAISLKLLEIYSKRKSAKQFETIASELYARTGGKGLDWEKTALMGRKLDPDNPLYSSKTVEPERTEAPSTELPPAAPVVAAVAAGVAAAAVAVEPSVEEAPETQAPVLSSLDFTISTPSPVSSNLGEMSATWTAPGQLGQLAQLDGDDIDIPLELQGQPDLPTEDQLPSLEGSLDAIDFDLDLGDAPATETPEPVIDIPAVEPVVEAPPADDLTLSLDIGDDAPVVRGRGEEVDSSAAGGGAAFGTVTVLGQDLDFDSGDAGLAFDLPEVSGAPGGMDLNATVVQSGSDAVGDDDAAMLDLEKTGFDNNLLDFDFDLDAATTATPVEPSGLDLTNIDLNLEPSADEDLQLEAATSDESVVPPTLEGLAVSGGDEIDHEVETKLELAKAYEEMGDKEGARELLEEVLREGSAAQQTAAEALIARLG